MRFLPLSAFSHSTLFPLVLVLRLICPFVFAVDIVNTLKLIFSLLLWHGCSILSGCGIMSVLFSCLLIYNLGLIDTLFYSHKTTVEFSFLKLCSFVDFHFSQVKCWFWQELIWYAFFWWIRCLFVNVLSVGPISLPLLLFCRELTFSGLLFLRPLKYKELSAIVLVLHVSNQITNTWEVVRASLTVLCLRLKCCDRQHQEFSYHSPKNIAYVLLVFLYRNLTHSKMTLRYGSIFLFLASHSRHYSAIAKG